MKYFPLLILLSVLLAQAQSGPCTENAVKAGKVTVADDAFFYMPPYGKPVVGKSAIDEANTKSFSDRTNIKSDWIGEHRIVASPSGDMAYEYGTVHMGYDRKAEGHQEFEAVVLGIYEAKDGRCQQVALTMQPLDGKSQH